MALEQIKTDGSETGATSAQKINISFAHTDANDLAVADYETRIAQNEIDIGDNETAIDNNATAIGNNDTELADHETRITENTTGLAAVGEPAVLSFVPQAVAPAWKRGQLFYDAGSESISMHSDIPGVTLNIGQEQYIRVINNTGTLILNGTILAQNGIASDTQLPQVIPAIADGFTASKILGLSTHDIPDGTEGFATTFGTVADLNTNGLTPGDALYLSDTDAGSWTTVAPDIASRLGYVVVSDITNGRVFVAPESNIALPTIFGELSFGISDATWTADTFYTISNFSSSRALSLVVDEAAGTITIPAGGGGEYRLTINLSIGYNDIGNSTETMTMRVLATDGSSFLDIPISMSKNSESSSFYPSVVFDAVEGKSYQLQLMCSAAITGVTYPLASFDLESVHIR